MIKRGIAMMLAAMMLTMNAIPANAAGATVQIMQETEETITETLEEESDSEASEESVTEENTEESGSETSEEDITEENMEEESGSETAEEDTEDGNSVNDTAGTQQTEATERLRLLAEQTELYALLYLAEFYDVKAEPASDAETVVTIASGQNVRIKDVSVLDNTLWYKVEILMEEAAEQTEVSAAEEVTCRSYEGYIERKNLVFSNELLAEWEATYLSVLVQDMEALATQTDNAVTFDAEVKAFPESYRPYIEKMKADHPNWHFVPFNIPEDFDVAAANQEGERSLVHSSVDDSWKGDYHSPGWYYAKPFVIRYYMDPRNFLYEEDVFQFEQLTYNASYHNVETVKQLLSKSFMAGDIPGEGVTYAATFMQAGIDSTVSPYHLASRVMQEQGAGTSALISGTYPGYEGLYNYFNVNASGKTTDEIIRNGLAYAREQGWTTRFKSITGGSNFIGNGYIKVGQDTLYLQKFDMVGTFYTHQYMQNIMAPTTEGRSIQKAYASAGAIDKSFVFKVPVYQNMPDSPCSVKQGNISMKRKVRYEDGLIAYAACSSYETDKKGAPIELVAYFDDDSKVGDHKDFKWSSSDTAVAVVDEAGKVTFNKPGSATVSATYIGSDSSYKGKKATCKVTVYGLWFENNTDSELTEYVLRIGSTQKIVMVSKLPSDLKDKKVTYTVKDAGVAEVDSKSQLVAKKAGITTLTAKAGEYSTEVLVVVLPESFEPARDIYYMKRGEAQNLEVAFSDKDIPAEVAKYLTLSYRSSNEAVAKVDAKGVVTAVSPGETMITISAGGLSVVCKVNVATNLTLIENKATGEGKTVLSIPFGSCFGSENAFPVPSSRTDSIFMGWYQNADGSGRLYDENTIMTGDETAYAYFAKISGSFLVKPIGDQTYTGSALKPEVKVYDGNRLLELNRDYKVTYKNNKAACVSGDKMPSVIVTGKGNYSGKQTITFKILPKNIGDSEIRIDDLVVAANGKKSNAKPVVYFGTGKLSNNKDYVLEWKDTSAGAYKDPGTYEITVTGKKNFTGTTVAKLVITSQIPAKDLTISSIPKQTYANGAAICPDVSVKYKKKILMEGKDYTISYRNNKEVGTATVVIRGIGEYAGTKEKNFSITGIALKKAKISGVENITFTGSSITQPKVVLNYNGKNLVEDVDYKVDYEKNEKAGKAVLVLTGMGGYTGTVKKKFSILPYDVSIDSGKVMKVVTPASVSYEKGGAKPKPEVYFKGVLLEEGVDYTVSYKNNGKATPADCASNKQPVIVIRGKGNFKGTVSKVFTVEKASILATGVLVDDALYANKKNAWKKVPQLYDVNGKKLSAGKDYEKSFQYTYADNTPVGANDIPAAGTKIVVTVTAKGDYEGSVSATYLVVNSSIAKAKVKVKNQTYSGSEIVPSKSDITITIGKNPALTAADYDIISISNNVEKGTATMVLRGKGNYGGIKTVKFKIVSKSFIW